MRSNAALGYRLLFFLSGATGLVYQLLWIRLLYQAFGSTIQSVTTVVAAYMGGLGLGAWLLGRRGDRHPKPAALYGWLEVAIGVYAVLSPLILELARGVYVGTAGALGLGAGASIALRFGLAALVLLVPTTLMGATLPVLTRAFMGEDRERLKPELGKLYGINTLGAVVGTGLAGFFLIEHAGIRLGLWLTAAVNIGLGAAAIALARPLALVAMGDGAPAAAPDTPRERVVRRTALVLLAVTAFASLLYEIAWTRVLVMIVGGSTYAFTLILLVFLLGIGLGSAIVARKSGPPTETIADAALAQGVTAAGAALLFIFFGFLPLYIISVFQIQFLGATPRLILMGVAVGIVVLVPAIGMGMTFPLLTDLVAGRDRARGADVGRAYGINTIGSIAGTVLTGFVFVVLLGSDRTVRLGLVLSVGAALALAALASRGLVWRSAEHRRLRARILGAGALAAIGLATVLAAPRFDQRLIDLGPTIYGRSTMNRASLAAFLEHRGSRQLEFREGWNVTVSVWESVYNRFLKVNGKTDASDFGDMDTQIMVGLAAAAARPSAASALVIGYGSGVSASALAAVPGMERVKIVEIEPAVLAMDRYFRHANDSVLFRPNVSVVVDDARSALQLSRDRFDVIVSEPSNPWLAGVATLYTPEFFRIARAHLAEDGVFGQWIQLYQLPLDVLAGIVRNLHAVFPHVEIWMGGPHDVVVLGSGRPLRQDPAWLARLLGPGAPLERPARDWLGMDAPEDYGGRFLLGERGVARLVEGAALAHSDDRPQLEFVAARRFLADEGTPALLDTLIRLRPADDTPERSSILGLAKALSVRPADPAVLAYIEQAQRVRPDDASWTVRVASVRLARRDTGVAEAMLQRVLARAPRNAAALLLTGQIATRQGPKEAARARSFLTAALAAGADTAHARAALAFVAARESLWGEAARELRGALAASRSTFRHSFPLDWLGDAFSRIALDGPPALADSLLAEAMQRRPGWMRLYEMRAVAALRGGQCEVGVENLIRLLDFGVERPDGPERVRECRARRGR